MRKTIKITESNLHKVIKRLVNEQEDIFDERFEEWDKEQNKMADIYNDISELLKPVLNNILDKYGEDFDLIANDDMIQNVVEDWLYDDWGQVDIPVGKSDMDKHLRGKEGGMGVLENRILIAEKKKEKKYLR